MRSELLLACISGPLLAALLLRGNARRLLTAVSGGMLAAFISGTVSGVLAGIVQYDSMAAVLYISPLVEEGAKLLLFALFHMAVTGRGNAGNCHWHRHWVFFAGKHCFAFFLWERVAAGAVFPVFLLLRDTRCVCADAYSVHTNDPSHGHGNRNRPDGRLRGYRHGPCAIQFAGVLRRTFPCAWVYAPGRPDWRR